MSDRDLYIAIYLAVISSGEPSNAFNVSEHAKALYDQLKKDLGDK